MTCRMYVGVYLRMCTCVWVDLVVCRRLRSPHPNPNPISNVNHGFLGGCFIIFFRVMCSSYGVRVGDCVDGHANTLPYMYVYVSIG